MSHPLSLLFHAHLHPIYHNRTRHTNNNAHSHLHTISHILKIHYSKYYLTVPDHHLHTPSLPRSCSPVQSRPPTQNGNTKPRPRPLLPTRRPRTKHPLRLPSLLPHTASHAPTATYTQRPRRTRQQHRQRRALFARTRHAWKVRAERSSSREIIRTLPLRAHNPESVCRHAGGGVGCDTSLGPNSQQSWNERITSAN